MPKLKKIVGFEDPQNSEKWKSIEEIIKNHAKSKQNQGQLIVNRAKWKNAQLWCKNKGFRFRIINEKDIFHGAR